MLQNETIYVGNNKIIIGNLMNIEDKNIKMTAGIRQQDIYYLIEEVINKKVDIQITNLPNENVFEYFKKDLIYIQAAGGVVSNELDELLFIYRNNIWDLPKGKLDENETIENCAVREVEEETGIKNIELNKFLNYTYHIYKLNNRYVLKQTDWFAMYALKQPLIAQIAEGITDAKWIAKQDLVSILKNSYCNIINTITAYYKS